MQSDRSDESVFLADKLSTLNAVKDTLTEETSIQKKEAQSPESAFELKVTEKQIAEIEARMKSIDKEEKEKKLDKKNIVTSENLEEFRKFLLEKIKTTEFSLRTIQLIRSFIVQMKKTQEYELKYFTQMTLDYQGIKLQLRIRNSEANTILLIKKLSNILKYYLDHLLSQDSHSAEDTFEIKSSKTYTEQAVLTKHTKLNTLFRAVEVELSIPKTFFSTLDRMKNQLLEKELCQRDKRITESSKFTVFKPKESLFGKDKDNLGVPPLFSPSDLEDSNYETLSDDKSFKKLTLILKENFKIDEALLKKIFTFNIKDFQEVKKNFNEDKKRAGFLKLNNDYNELKDGLMNMLVRFNQKKLTDNDRSMRNFLLECFFYTLDYLISMSIVKYPAWLNNNSLSILNDITKMSTCFNDNPQSEDYFKKILKQVEDGKEYFNKLKEIIAPKEKKLSVEDLESCGGYLGLIAENLDYFPSLIKDQEMFKQNKACLSDLAKQYERINQVNDLALKIFLNYQRAFKIRDIFHQGSSLVVSKIQKNQIEFIDKQLKDETISDELRSKLKTKREILSKKLISLSSQQDEYKLYGIKQLPDIKQQEFFYQILGIRARLTELAENFRQFEHTTHKTYIEEQFEKFNLSFSAVILNAKILSSELIDKTSSADLAAKLSQFSEHMKEISKFLDQANHDRLKLEKTSISQEKYVNAHNFYKKVMSMEKSLNEFRSDLSTTGSIYEPR